MFEDQPAPPSNLPLTPAGGRDSDRSVGATPPNLPVGPEPEDMFESVEPESKVAPQGPVSAPSAPHPTLSRGEREVENKVVPPEAPAQVKEPLVASRKTIMIVGGVVGALVLAGVVVGVIRFVRSTAQITEAPGAKSATLPLPEVPALPAVLSEPVSEAPGLPLPAEAVAPEPDLTAQDSDGDGLTDAQEAERGTDSMSPDSDNDGLFDGEEIETYRTDPLDPDTDGDGYLDGAEVQSGYDPNGPGKLFTVPSQ